MPPSSFLDCISALGDPTRLRLLALLEPEELGVGELARVVQLPQSTVSRHLKVLLEGGLITNRPVGTSSLYRFLDTLPEPATQLWTIARAEGLDPATSKDDLLRLDEVIRARHLNSREFFGRIGGEWDDLRSELFGDAFTTDALLGLLDPAWVVADIGCGTGNAAERFAPYVARVIAIDREPAMLDAARKRLSGFDNIDFRQGDVSDLPLESSEADAAIVVLLLHHLESPGSAIHGIEHGLKPGGVALVVDMMAHDRETYRHTMGHVHLGFSESDVEGWCNDTSLDVLRFRRLRPDTASKGPGLFAATLRKT